MEIIEPPRHLGTKAVRGRGPSLDMILARSEPEIAALATQYATSLQSDLAALQRNVAVLRGAKATAGARQASRAAIEEIYARCHELRGLAGSFGYPLVSRIADSLCRFVELAGGAPGQFCDVIAAHVDAIRAVVHQDAGVDGGSLGRALMAGLQRLSDHALARRDAS